MSLITQLAYTRDPPVHVRVGAERFVTSLGTLCQQPGSLLAALFTEPFPLQDEFTGEHVISLDVISAPAFAIVLDYLRSGDWLPVLDRETLEEVRRGCQNLGLRVKSFPAEPARQPQAFSPDNFVGEVEAVSIDTERPPHSGTFELHYAVADLGRRGYRVVAEGHGCSSMHTSGMSDAHNRAVAAVESQKHYDTNHRADTAPSIVLQRCAPRYGALESVLKAPVERDDGAWLRCLLTL